MTRLWRIEGKALKAVPTAAAHLESALEDWIARDSGILGLELLIIGRQCRTDDGGIIDLLAIDREGDLTLIECKRDRTPREVVAQLLDYASWVVSLTEKRVYSIANSHLGQRLDVAFRERFGTAIPDNLNTAHNLLIVATEFDASSRRIVEYLAKEHDVSINTVFFGYFKDAAAEYLSADWLMDQDQVVERAEQRSKAPWSGFYYVNAGHDPTVRIWDDMQKYGYVAAGYRRFYSGRLDQLSPGDALFVYQKGSGYIGYGIVTSPAVMSKDFVTADGKLLKDVALKQPKVLHDPDNPELSDYLVGINWKKTVPISEAFWLDGGFANQNVVCKLRHAATLSFLMEKFNATAPDAPIN